MTCRNTVSLGAYLLGALDPAERSTYEDHMDTCATCQAELLRLAPLPGLLQRMTPADFDAIEAAELEDEIPDWLSLPVEAELVDPLPEEAQAPPRQSWLRRHRLALAAAAAVVLLAIGGVVMFQPPPPQAVIAAPVTWTADDPTTGVHGSVDLVNRAWGTEVRLSMDGVPPGHKICHLIVYSRDGASEVAGKWTAGYYKAITSVPGSTSIKLADIERIEVIAGSGLLIGIPTP
jgi:anti-sigma factor RsiW